MPATSQYRNNPVEESKEHSDEDSSPSSSNSSDELSDFRLKPPSSPARFRSFSTITRTISPAAAASVPIPPKILSGWRHRAAPSPRRVAKSTNLGAIDEDTDAVSPDAPVRAHQRPARTLNFNGLIQTLHSSRDLIAYSKYDDMTGHNGERVADPRINRSKPRRSGWISFVCSILVVPVLIIALGLLGD